LHAGSEPSGVTEADKLYREACLRHHRTLAHYFAVLAWKHGADCVVIGRNALQSLFNLQVFKAKRLEWIEEDVRPWFPHIESRSSLKAARLEAVVLSRRELPRSNSVTISPPSAIAESLGRAGLSAIAFPSVRAAIPDESDIVSSMSLIASALLAVDMMPGLWRKAA
jgi:hypothetical protein